MADVRPLTAGGGWRGVVWFVDDANRVRCWCCLATGENDVGRECNACDGSGAMPDTILCRPLCRHPDRTPPPQVV